MSNFYRCDECGKVKNNTYKYEIYALGLSEHMFLCDGCLELSRERAKLLGVDIRLPVV